MATSPSPVDSKKIVADARALLKQLDEATPHINKAQTAFGGMEETQAKSTDLRNRLTKIIATYSA